VTIIGASFDPPEENLAWAQEEAFAYDLWSDLSRELGLYYGATDDPTDTTAARITVLLDAEGAVLLEYDVGIGFGTHPADVLSDCQALFGA
jgi:peroxiredoxin